MSKVRFLSLIAVVTMLSVPVLGGTLATDSNAMAAWRGSVVIDDFSGLSAVVDYAVYAPGTFSYSGFTPAANEYVYAYQVQTTGTVEINWLNVLFLESNEANTIGSFDLSGVAPANSQFGSPLPGGGYDSAVWEIGGGGLTGGQASDGLAYSSVNEPLLWWGSIADGGLAAFGELPSPSNVIPEPVTIGLLGLGVVGLLRRKR